MTDESSADFMAKGIVSTYLPVEQDGEIPEGQISLSSEDWLRLYMLAHTDKAAAYDHYAAHYLQTDGLIGVNYFCRCASIILAGRPPVEDAVELPRSDSWGRRTPG